MTIEQAQAFLIALKAPNVHIKNDIIVQSSCPLAAWTHQSHKDLNPSFALFCKPGETTYYHCFTCGDGSAEDLIGAIGMYAKDDLSSYDLKAARLILENEQFVVPLPEYSEGVPKQQVFEAWPEWWLESFQTVAYSQPSLDYLASRKVTPDEAQEFELHYDHVRQMIVFPYWSVYGKFAGARGRSILPGVGGAKKHYDYKWNQRNNSKLTWYNEQCLNLPGPVVVVEGQYDVLRVWKRWKKVVGNLTGLVVEAKIQKLCESEMLIHIPDADQTGERSVEGYMDAAKRCGLKYRKIDVGEGVKDPGDCHEDFLYDKIMEELS
jgi:DNA primase